MQRTGLGGHGKCGGTEHGARCRQQVTVTTENQDSPVCKTAARMECVAAASVSARETTIMGSLRSLLKLKEALVACC